jgi:hypothetical protein
MNILMFISISREMGEPTEGLSLESGKMRIKPMTLVTRKKKLVAPKHVHFDSPIRQHSPKRKYVPLQSPHNVKIGNFICTIAKAHAPRIAPCLIKEHSSIPVTKVFGSPKNHLHRNNFRSDGAKLLSNLNSTTAQELPRDLSQDSISQASSPNVLGTIPHRPMARGPKEGEGAQTTERRGNLGKDLSLNALSFKTFRGCFCFLGYDHWARECQSQIRCRYCFTYGHIERRCRKRIQAFNCCWWPKVTSCTTHKDSQESTSVNEGNNSNASPLLPCALPIFLAIVQKSKGHSPSITTGILLSLPLPVFNTVIPLKPPSSESSHRPW